MNKRLWQVHSWMGLLSGVFLLVIGLTGSVLVFSHELEPILDPALTRVEPGEKRVPLDLLWERADAAKEGWWVSGLDFEASVGDPRASVAVWVKKGKDYAQVHLDPYRGEVLGSRESWFLRWLLELHYSFFLGDWGMALAFLFGVVLMFSGLTGLWLHGRLLAGILNPIRWDKGVRLVYGDFHRVIGFWALLFNLLLGFTGAWMNWSAVKGLFSQKPAPKEEALPSRPRMTLEKVRKSALAALPDLEVTYYSIPGDEKEGFTVWGRVPGAWLYGPYNSTVVVDQVTGAVRETKDIRKVGWKEKFEALIGPLHFGNFGGIPVKVLYCIGGLTPGLLCVTGFVMWRKRRRLE